MTQVLFGIGSNLGDRLAYLQGAVDALAADRIGFVKGGDGDDINVRVGGPDQPDFLNGVVLVESDLAPHRLLELAHAIERAAARERVVHWGPRTLDVDVLVFGDTVVDDPDLVVPHPRIAERGFVLAPMRDVAPDVAARFTAETAWDGVRPCALALTLPGG
jgi:2-amino-4-hydroxy-6-hydroxymethyldihydropteridine diphosphokinase